MNHMLQKCLILNFRLVTVTENVFCLRYKTNFPKDPNQSRQLPVLTIPDCALCLCAARLCYYHDIKKSFHHKMFMMR